MRVLHLSLQKNEESLQEVTHKNKFHLPQVPEDSDVCNLWKMELIFKYSSIFAQRTVVKPIIIVKVLTVLNQQILGGMLGSHYETCVVPPGGA